MHSVVIVEDEYWTLKGIIEVFPWAEYNMEITSSFAEPIAAVEYILKSKPDIVITDIEMPEMSGIALIKKLRERKCKSLIVVLSAHPNFEYAQKLIPLRIFEYCLKPFSREDASNILNRLKISLDSKSEILTDIDLHDYNSPNTRFRNIVSYVNNHYNENFTLEDLCADYNLNPDYCNKLFIRQYGCTYSNYLKNLRMEKACYLLRQNESIANVAAMVGYNDYYYFSKIFKKHVGVTPYQYKNNN